MKIAFCLSGHVRNFIDCKNSFTEQIVKKYNPDIFIHTWDEYGYGRNGSSLNLINEETKLAIEKNKHLGLSSNTEFLRGTPKVDLNLFSDLNIKNIVVEKYDEIESEIISISKKVINKWDIDYPPNFISSLRKIKLCNDLRISYEKQENIEYNLVVRSRPDIIYHDVFFEEPKNTFYTPVSQSYHAVSDIFFYSSPDVMNNFCTFYDCLHEYIVQKVHFNPHSLMMHHLDKRKISYTKDTRLNLDILRM